MPVRENTVVVRGYSQLVRAFARTELEVELGLRETLKEVGEIVRRDAAARFSSSSAKSAAGFRTVVFQRGVDIRQSLRKTTGTRPDWGARQMTEALLPALDANQRKVEYAFGQFLDEVVVSNFGR